MRLNSNRGGKREGAGRKPLPYPYKRVSVTLPEELAERWKCLPPEQKRYIQDYIVDFLKALK